MNTERVLKIVCGVVASLLLLALAFAAWLSDPIGRRHAVFFFGVLAILVFLEWRKTRRLAATACINCQRDALFCWPCCDAIGKPDAGGDPEIPTRPLVLGFMRDCNEVGIDQAARNLHRRIKEACVAAPSEGDSP